MINGRQRAVVVLTALLAAVLAALAGPGCGGGPERSEAVEGGEEGIAAETSGEEREAVIIPPGGGGVVHMCGRSVLAGWFEHWGWDHDPENPVRRFGHTLLYHEMEVPPGILETAREVIREASREEGGAVFFKLCFADFEGGDEDTARLNLERNEGIAGEVAKAAVEAGVPTLILGNALPVVSEYCDRWLVWNQREYNAFLEGLARRYPGRVMVLDLYGTLATPEGWLRPEYAADAHDSHLNGAAYGALDGVLGAALSGP